MSFTLQVYLPASSGFSLFIVILWSGPSLSKWILKPWKISERFLNLYWACLVLFFRYCFKSSNTNHLSLPFGLQNVQLKVTFPSSSLTFMSSNGLIHLSASFMNANKYTFRNTIQVSMNYECQIVKPIVKCLFDFKFKLMQTRIKTQI